MKKYNLSFLKIWLCYSLFIAFFCSFTLNLHAQTVPPQKLWDKTFGGSSTEWLSSLQQTSDGGYILGGSSTSPVSGDKSQPSLGTYDYWVVKLDASGNKLWDKTFGGNQHDHLFTLQQTTDGGYILGGYSNSGMNGDKSQASKGLDDFWIVKLDASGNKQWDKTFGGNSVDENYAIIQTSDGGYLLGGHSYSSASGDKSQSSKGDADYWIIKLDASGNKQWDKTLGGNGKDVMQALQQTNDGGYIIGGTSDTGINGDKSQLTGGGRDYWVVKLDVSGNKLWDKTFGGSGTENLNSLKQTNDGGYILGGWSESGASGDKTQPAKGYADYWVVKIDSAGIKSWDKTFGGSSNSSQSIQSLQQTSDGGYIIGGHSNSPISGDKTEANKSQYPGMADYWIIKLDSIGNKLWDKTIGGDREDRFYSLQQTADGGFILGGYSDSFVSSDKSQGRQGATDYWVVKLAAPCTGLTASLLTLCSNGTVNVSVNIAGIQPGATGAPSWTLTYMVNGTLQTVSGTSNTLDLAQNAAPGTIFTLTSIVSGACSKNLTNSITVPTIPVAPTVISGSNCGTGSVTLSATGTPLGGSYAWYNVPAGGTALYTNSSGVFTTPNLLATTTFYVAALNNTGCEGPRTPVVATINTLPTVNAGVAQLICETSPPIQLSGFSPAGGIWTGSGVNPSGLFTPAANLIGNQTLTYSISQNGCTISATKTIAVTAKPVINAGPDQAICAAVSPFQLTGFSPVGGTWSGNGVNQAGLFTPGNSLIGIQKLTYSFSQNGCTVNSTKEITVTAKPVISAGTNEIICENSTPKQLTGFSPASGIWSGPGVSTSGIFTPRSELIGTHTLTYTFTQNGCNVSTTKQIIVKPVQQISLGADKEACEGEEIILDTQLTSGAFIWSDGSNNSFLKVRNSGKYWVRFTVGDCSSSDTIQVAVKACPKPFLPNIITMNNDGKNDTFKPQHLPDGKWHLQIYNRWGVKIFESEDYQNNWPEKNISDGTYYYLLRNSETGQQFKGWVEVIQ